MVPKSYPSITELVSWIKELIKNDNIHEFYNSKWWKILCKEILKTQHYECQRCKAKGRYKRATMVHHKKYLRRFPWLALSRENCEALCSACHYDEHHRRKGYMNEERW